MRSGSRYSNDNDGKEIQKDEVTQNGFSLKVRDLGDSGDS